MAKENAGDFRDFPRIDTWARDALERLRAASPRPLPRPHPSRAAPIGLALAGAIGVLALALWLAIGPGRVLAAILLPLLVAVPLVLAAWQQRARADYADFVSLLGGVALSVGSAFVLATGLAPLPVGLAGLALALLIVIDAATRIRALVAENEPRMRRIWPAVEAVQRGSPASPPPVLAP